MSPATVVVLAQEADAPADAVVGELDRRNVTVFRADTAWFPQRLALRARLDGDGRWRGALATDRRRVNLEDIGAVWYRDPSAFVFLDALSDAERAYAHREARLGLGGVLASLPVRWVNNPNRAADAMYKPLQLTTAAACGLRVPPTVVTNVPPAASGFLAEHGPSAVVVKSFGPNSVTEGGHVSVAYTRRLDDVDATHLGGVASTATQFQRWVDKTHEARVVVVGERMFAVAIMAGSPEAWVDWRADFAARRYRLVEAPGDVETGLRRYMHTMGLAYAAVDFAIDADGRWWFLESNSAGQYLWLEARTGAPITAALDDDGRLRSTSSQPGLMTRMIEALRLTTGMRVLEIGAGTGYNAALLCHLVGEKNVYSVDVEPDLVDLAGERLAGLALRPTLKTGDGADGLPAHAPYDAVVATCAVSTIPPAWIEQLRPGGVLLTDLKTAVNAGALVRLVRTGPGRVDGRFDPTYAAFMALRHTPGVSAAPVRVAHDHDRARRRTTDLDPRAPWTLLVAWFLASFDLGPDIALGRVGGEAGATSIATPDGSWAEIDGHDVTEGGPRDLWTLLESAHRTWLTLGSPGWDRLGLTVSGDRQYV